MTIKIHELILNIITVESTFDKMMKERNMHTFYAYKYKFGHYHNFITRKHTNNIV